MSRLLPLIAGAALLGSAPTLHLPEPASFPAAAREALHQRMSQHADQLEWLLSAALMLNYDLAATAATRLAEDPKLARPRPGDVDTLNAALPKGFFDLQERMVKQARAVAAAARTHDDARIAKTVGRLTETCVACHSVYLYGAMVEPPPNDETP
jgi:cytochrome c556